MIDFALKWTGTAFLIIGTFVNGFGIYPQGVIMLAIGGQFWFAAAWRARDTALMTTNVVLSVAGMVGVVYNYFG